MQEKVSIRKFKVQDRKAVRDIAWETAFIGESAEVFFWGKEVLADFLTLYFTDYEPDSCFVAESQFQVVGYLIGSRDSLRLAGIFKNKILFKLLAKFIFSGTLFRWKNLRLISGFFLSFLKGEFNTIETDISYPAILHINFRKGFRNKGAGSQLILVFEQYLKSKGIRGVHLATLSESAGVFFRKQGFNLLFKCRRTYFRHILGRDIALYIYGKKL